MDTTTITISRDNWAWLNEQRQPGDSMDDIVSRVRARQADLPAVDIDTIVARHDLDDGEGAAVEGVVRYLERTYPGWAQKQEIIDAVHSEHPAEKGADWWWRQLVTEVLVADGVVEKFGGDQGLVRLAGE